MVLVSNFLRKHIHCFAIFEGLGINGKLCANFLENIFLMTIKQNLRLEIINNPLAVVVEAALEKTFHDLHWHLKSQTMINPDFSGSMLTIVLVINDILYSANVGNVKGI